MKLIMEDDLTISFKAIIIDNGSCLSKIGNVGEPKPRLTFPNLIGYYRNATWREKEYYIGEEALNYKDF